MWPQPELNVVESIRRRASSVSVVCARDVRSEDLSRVCVSSVRPPEAVRRYCAATEWRVDVHARLMCCRQTYCYHYCYHTKERRINIISLCVYGAHAVFLFSSARRTRDNVNASLRPAMYLMMSCEHYFDCRKKYFPIKIRRIRPV